MHCTKCLTKTSDDEINCPNCGNTLSKSKETIVISEAKKISKVTMDSHRADDNQRTPAAINRGVIVSESEVECNSTTSVPAVGAGGNIVISRGAVVNESKIECNSTMGAPAVGAGGTIVINIYPHGAQDELPNTKKYYPSKKPVRKIVNTPANIVDPLTHIEFVYVKGGEFRMGDVSGDLDADESFACNMIVDDFYIGKYPVTQRQWRKIMMSNPSKFQGDERPLENVSWEDVQTFISKLNQKTKKNKYRLPTDAEWEYAARSGGMNEQWPGTSNESELENYAWYDKSRIFETSVVGQKNANSLGLYDMSGNVWEWCSKLINCQAEDNAKLKDKSKIIESIIRGGCWSSSASDCSVIAWHFMSANTKNDRTGFRLVCTK